MNKILSNELLAYVGELRQAIEVSTLSPSDSTTASADSPELVDHCLNMKMFLKEGMSEYNLMCFCIPIIEK
jgi:hypothetical protein